MPPRDLARVLDALPDGAVVIDASGSVELLSAEASRILGLSRDAARGRAVERLAGADHAVARLARAALGGGGTSLESSCPVAQRFGPALVVEVGAAPLFDDTGALCGAVVTLRDRTLQQELSHAVSEREQLEAFGRIAAGIAHEVKNPLGGIRGAGELLALRAADGKTREAAELIVREADRISALVDDLMVFARGDALRLSPMNVHVALDDVLDLLAHDPVGARCRVERRYDPSLPEIHADADRLVQAFLNLARNALQAMEERGGTLVIATRMTLGHRLAGNDGEPSPTLLIEFRDDGPGIDPDLLDRLGTPFLTTRPGGTGLGIALARHWIARHGGTLRLESEPGNGTIARVGLPLRRTSPRAAS
jgi:two-component system nitrogen regulation sensor histidine kinase GlnL